LGSFREKGVKGAFTWEGKTRLMWNEEGRKWRGKGQEGGDQKLGCMEERDKVKRKKVAVEESGEDNR